MPLFSLSYFQFPCWRPNFLISYNPKFLWWRTLPELLETKKKEKKKLHEMKRDDERFSFFHLQGSQNAISGLCIQCHLWLRDFSAMMLCIERVIHAYSNTLTSSIHCYGIGPCFLSSPWYFCLPKQLKTHIKFLALTSN